MRRKNNYPCLTYISLLLSGVSSALALLPFYYIWKIIKEVLEVMPNFENAEDREIRSFLWK
jgi:ATP-binding cassette subfamily B protein